MVFKYQLNKYLNYLNICFSSSVLCTNDCCCSVSVDVAEKMWISRKCDNPNEVTGTVEPVNVDT